MSPPEPLLPWQRVALTATVMIMEMMLVAMVPLIVVMMMTHYVSYA